MGNDTGKPPRAQPQAAMSKKQHRLSALEVQRESKPGRHHDGGGLYLQIAKSGAKSWVLRYQIGGKSRMLGLGPVRVISLKQARERAQAARQQLVDDTDPVEARKAKRVQARLEAAQSTTFREVAEDYMETHSRSWRSAVHRQQWHQSLEQYVYPVIGDLPVAAIDKLLVHAVLKPIWWEKHETASRVRGRIESVLDYAIAADMRSADNPAKYAILQKLLPVPETTKSNFAAMPFAEVPTFVAELHQQEGTAARALEFAILTAARTGEVLGARWSEIDLDARIWTVPASRIKAKRQHRVPLSARAIEILETLPREAGSEFVFLGTRAGKPLHSHAMLKLLQAMRPGEAATIHGFRAAFSTWADETTNFSPYEIEMSLAHTVGNAVSRAYRRGDMLDKRRALMDAWASFCAGEAEGKVVQLFGA